MARKWLRYAIPVAAAVAVVPFFVVSDDWGSSCACIPVNESFGHLSGTSVRALFRENGESSVTSGLNSRWRGKRLVEAQDVLQMFSEARCSSGPDVYACEIWLERKDNQRRGYEVALDLSPDKDIKAVRAKIIRKN